MRIEGEERWGDLVAVIICIVIVVVALLVLS